MDKGLISDLLKTPSQIRKENDQRRLTEGLAMAQLAQQGNTLGGVGGMFANFGAQQAAQTGRNISNAFRGVTDAIGTVTGADLRPADERAAGQDQAIMRGVKTNDPASMRKAAERITNPKAREALLAKADAIDTSRASVAATAAQQATDNAFKEREVLVKELEAAVKAGKSQADIDNIRSQISERDALLGFRVQTAEAGARSAGAQADVDVATVDSKIAQAGANLNLTTTQVAELSQNIAQAAQKFPEELKGLTLDNLSTQAATALATARANRVTELTPLEVKKIVEETELLGYQAESTQALTEQRKAELKDVGATDFLRELSAANLSPEEEQRLIKERLEARAATGGVSGFGESVLNARLTQLTEYIQTGKDARKSLVRAENVLSVMNQADIGKFSSAKAFANSWLASMGIESAKAATAANELIKVLQGEITLAAAGNLKGALSDKDLAFLQDTIPSKDMSPEGVRNIFTLMAAERSAEVYAATQMDEYLATASSSDIRSTPVATKAEEFMAAGRRVYLFEKKKAGLYSGPMERK